jgi:hypothetical protein
MFWLAAYCHNTKAVYLDGPDKGKLIEFNLPLIVFTSIFCFIGVFYMFIQTLQKRN